MSKFYKIAIKTSVRRYRKRLQWGDWHYAVGLKDAFERIGHQVRIDCFPEWQREPDFSDIDLVLRGHDEYTGEKNHVIWVIYPGTKPRPIEKLYTEFERSGNVAVASYGSFQQLDVRDQKFVIRPLMQATDARKGMVDKQPDREGFVFVGNAYRNRMRPIIQFAIEAEVPVRIFGKGYSGTAAEKWVEAEYFPNEELGALYQSAKAVLCDHHPSMRIGGYISNRIYDAVACGAPVISDDVSGVPDYLKAHVFKSNSVTDFVANVRSVEAEEESVVQKRQDFAMTFARDNSFDARVSDLLEMINAAVQ